MKNLIFSQYYLPSNQWNAFTVLYFGLKSTTRRMTPFSFAKDMVLCSVGSWKPSLDAGNWCVSQSTAKSAFSGVGCMGKRLSLARMAFPFSSCPVTTRRGSGKRDMVCYLPAQILEIELDPSQLVHQRLLYLLIWMCYTSHWGVWKRLRGYVPAGQWPEKGHINLTWFGRGKWENRDAMFSIRGAIWPMLT